MWVRQCDLDAQQEAPPPITARIASNEEFIPPAQSCQQREYEARVAEIGRMLGGDMVTDGLKASAEEMLRLRLEHRTGVAPGAQAKGERMPKGESERAKAKGRRGA